VGPEGAGGRRASECQDVVTGARWKRKRLAVLFIHDDDNRNVDIRSP